MTTYPNLFSPMSIGGMELKNKLVMAPMATNFAELDGSVNQRLLNYYEERATGQVGLIISESNYIQPRGRGGPGRLGLYDDALIEGHVKLAEVVHAHGAKIAAQLHHAGRTAREKIIGETPIAPSATETAREMTLEEIEEARDDFALAAGRAKKAGFDAVQIHGAHGYMINQFLSPLSNQRTDRYGGDGEARMSFLLEVFEAIKEEVGGDYPIMVRLSGEEHYDGGYGLDYILEVCTALDKAGVVAFDLSGSISPYPGKPAALPSKDDPPRPLVPYAVALKKVVDAPVGAVGRLNTPQIGEQLLQEGKADFILLGRSLLVDSLWVVKAKEGVEDDIVHCITCNHCIDVLMEDKDVKCSMNQDL